MCGTSAVCMQDVNWTKNALCTSRAVPHIRSCGYAWVYPQMHSVFACVLVFLPKSCRSRAGVRTLAGSAPEFFLARARQENGKRTFTIECAGSAATADTCIVEPGIFFRPAIAFEIRRQVYNQSMYTKIVVVVNGPPQLWTSLLFSTTSSVYGPHKAVNGVCICQLAKLDKFLHRADTRAFAQSVPVDMQKLIHSPIALMFW
jgi:hypothetical protein